MLPTIMLCGLIIISGWLIQRRGFCLVAAVEDLAKGKLIKLLSILLVSLLSGAVLMVLSAVEFQFYNHHQFLIAILGAIIFGFGAALNNGCFFGTLTQLFKGNSNMFFTLIGIVSTSVLIPPLENVSLLTNHDFSLMNYMLVFSALILFFLLQKHKDKYHYLTWLLIPGITLGVINTSTFGWSVSQLIINIGYFVYSDSRFIPLQFIEFSSFLFGMWLYHFKYSQFKWQKINQKYAFKNFIAGVIMVVGARMMGGGNDTLLFKKLPTLMPGILLLLITLILSIYLTKDLIGRWETWGRNKSITKF